MSGECDKCSEHCLDCQCMNIHIHAPDEVYEKFLVFEAIIAFIRRYDSKDLGTVSIKDLSDFVDELFLRKCCGMPSKEA